MTTLQTLAPTIEWWRLARGAWYRDGVVPAKPRDVQRTRVYRAEDGFLMTHRRRIETVRGLQREVDAIVGSPWWSRRAKIERVDVHDGRGRRSAAAWRPSRTEGAISIPRWFRCEAIVLHELAHVMTGALDHGPLFCTGYLDLVREWMSEDACAALMGAFDGQRVRYAPYSLETRRVVRVEAAVEQMTLPFA